MFISAATSGPCPSRPAFGGHLRMTEIVWRVSNGPSSPQRLQLRRGAGAEEAEIAADGEKANAALGAGDGALGVGAIETGDFAGVAARCNDLVERGFNGIGVRVEFFAVGQPD